MFSKARSAEIVRSNQKDDYYISYIRNSLSDISQTLLGPRLLLKWRQELDLFAETGYFLLTTLAGFQTLGEEYVNIVQVDSSQRAIPSSLRRGGMVLLQVITPYVINRCLTWLEKQFQHNMSLNISPEKRKAICDILTMCRHTVTVLHRCHLALFYMTGVFYHLAKRMSGIRYLLVRGGMDDAWTPNYKILGWLTIIQLVVTFLQQLYHMWKLHHITPSQKSPSEIHSDHAVASKVSSTDTYVNPSQKCSLCLEARKHSTATPCGHVYCWDCITEWGLVKPECPMCRAKFELPQLICLRNFDPQ